MAAASNTMLFDRIGMRGGGVALGMVVAVTAGACRLPSPPAVVGRFPVFAPPDVIGDCGSRPAVFELDVDVGAPYPNWRWEPLSWAVPANAYLRGDLLILFVPEVDPAARALSVDAIRVDLSTRRRLPASRAGLGDRPGSFPRYTDLFTTPSGDDFLVVWSEPRSGARAGLRFSPADGRWGPAAGAELTTARPRGGLDSHPAFPPNPDPATGVRIDVLPSEPVATFTDRNGNRMGSIAFPTNPGAFVGTFANSRTALFWSNVPPDRQKDYPAAQRMESYLVDLDTGATCRVERARAAPRTAGVRSGDPIVLV